MSECFGYQKVDPFKVYMLPNIHSHRGQSMYGIKSTDCVHTSSVSMFKNRIDKYLVKEGYI